MSARRIALVFALALFGCDDGAGTDAGAMDSGARDAGGLVDAGDDVDAGIRVDAGSADGGGELDAALGEDAGTPFGTIGGACGVLDDELTSPSAFVFEETIVVPAGGIEAMRLGVGARRILAEPNAGGSSRYSEALAFEILEQCEGASLIATENEVMYMSPNPPAKTDFLSRIDGLQIGVSVTRGFSFSGLCMPSGALTATAAESLLRDKLMDVVDASMAVATVHRWQKEIIVALVDDPSISMTMLDAWNGIEAVTRGDTILIVVTTSGADNQVYFEDRCAP
ncbi:MAG: hypothetical protein AB7S26_05470 [Sandaracinaceae bacterium]